MSADYLQVADFSKMRRIKELCMEANNFIIRDRSKGTSFLQIAQDLKQDYRTIKKICQMEFNIERKKKLNFDPLANEGSLTYKGILSRSLIHQVHAYFRQLEHQLWRDERDAGHLASLLRE